jgi:hypothetical protein
MTLNQGEASFEIFQSKCLLGGISVGFFEVFLREKRAMKFLKLNIGKLTLKAFQDGVGSEFSSFAAANNWQRDKK